MEKNCILGVCRETNLQSNALYSMVIGILLRKLLAKQEKVNLL